MYKEITLKRKQVRDIYSKLKQYSNVRGNIQFSYWYLKNMDIFEKEFNLIFEAFKKNEDAYKFEQERIILCMNYSKKDDKGEVLFDNFGNFIIDEEKRDDFEKSMEELRKKYNYEEIQKFLFEFENQFLDEDVKITVYQLDIKNLPENVFTIAEIEYFVKAGLILIE